MLKRRHDDSDGGADSGRSLALPTQKSTSVSSPQVLPPSKRITLGSSLDNIPSSEFLDIIGALDSSRVTVHVGTNESRRKHFLPKELLCHHSSYFKAVFDGKFKESKEASLELHGVEIEPFELLIQWLYLGSFVLPDLPCKVSYRGRRSNAASQDEKKISRYLAFLKLADRLCINEKELGNSVVGQVREMLREKREYLTAEHIQMASAMPQKHPIRTLFAQAYVAEYFKAKRTGHKHRFQDEVNNLEMFAANMTMAVAELAIGMKSSSSSQGKMIVIMTDPLSDLSIIF